MQQAVFPGQMPYHVHCPMTGHAVCQCPFVPAQSQPQATNMMMSSAIWTQRSGYPFEIQGPPLYRADAMMFVHPDGQSEDRACLEDKIRCLTRNVEEASAKASKAAVQAGMSYNVATGELSPLPDGTGGVESVEALQARLNALREEVAVQQQQEALLESQIQADLQAHQQNRGAALHQVWCGG
ncbi:hypothetical protein Vafri_19593 [Volvox africanus]|uniref:Uncharacterized protein n=1 Tax=Volvox africanus TaxID=51714 RepID=A0A8J4BQR2_9CHLO|nr:hypothetical protein Vafri_19593 [Volvox africanus]